MSETMRYHDPWDNDISFNLKIWSIVLLQLNQSDQSGQSDWSRETRASSDRFQKYWLLQCSVQIYRKMEKMATKVGASNRERILEKIWGICQNTDFRLKEIDPKQIKK